MPNYQEGIAQAKAAGYSDQEIAQHLRADLGPQIQAAQSAGYKPEEVRDHLTSQGLPPDLAFDFTATTGERIGKFAGAAWQKVKDAAQPVAKLLTLPGRGVRGIGVGAERLAAGDSPSKAAERAAEAVKPGYQPKDGEKFGATAGEMLGNAPLFTALGAPVAAVLPEAATLGGMAARGAVEGGAVGAAYQPIADVSATGKTSAASIAHGAKTGAIIGAVASPIIGAASRALASRSGAQARAAQEAATAEAQKFAPQERAQMIEKGLTKPAFLRAPEGNLKADLAARIQADKLQTGVDGERFPAPERGFLTVGEHPFGPPPPPAPVQPQLEGPVAPKQLSYEQPVQGEGFTMAPERVPLKQVYTPEAGDVRVPENDLQSARAAAARRLGLVPPQDARLQQAKPVEVQQGLPEVPKAKVTKADVRSLVRDGDRIFTDPARVDQMVEAVKKGTATDAQASQLVNRAQSRYRILAKTRGVEHPETQAVGAALEKMGFQRPEVGLEQPPFDQAPEAPAPQQTEPSTPTRVEPSADYNPPPSGPKPAAPETPSRAPQAAIDDAPPWVTESDPEVARAQMDQQEADAGAQFEDEAIRSMGGGSRTPVTDAVIRHGGIDRAGAEKFGYGGEIGRDFKGRPGVFNKNGSAKLDEIAQDLSASGILPEGAGPYELLEAIQHEHANNRPLYAVTAPDMARGQGGFVRFGARPGTPADPPPVAAIKSAIKENPEAPRRTIRETFDTWFTKLVDAANPIKTAEKKGGGGGKFSDALNRYLGVGDTVAQRLERGTYKVIDGKMTKTGEGLQPILRDFDNTFFPQHGDTALDDLRAYMIAQRNLELAERGVHGVKPTESQAALDYLSQKYGGQLDQFADRLRDWQDRAILEPLMDSGILSEEQVLQMKMANQKHIPFDRVLEEVDPGGSKFETGSPIKKIEGSEKDVYDPFQRMIGNAYRAAQAAERNNVYRSVADLRGLTPDLAEALKPAPQSGADTITVWNNGEREFYHAPKEFRESLDNLHTQDIGPLGRFLSIFARAQRAGITQHPRFSLYRNPARDQITAYMNAKYGFTPGIDFAKGFFELMGKGDYYEEWVAAGGGNSTVVAMDRNSAQVSLRKLRGLRELDSLSPITLLQNMSETMENSTRLGVYKRARVSGASIEQAVSEAKDVTVNFGLHGSDPTFQKLNAITAFQRPAVLSSARFFRQLADAPGQTLFRGFTGLTAPSLALWYVNKDNRDYQEQPAWKKNTFWFIPAGTKKDGSTRFIEIPKPFEYGVLFGSLPERVADHIYHKDPKAIEDWFTSMRNSVDAPIVPTVLKPIVDTAANYNSYTGRSIVPKSRANTLPPDQYGDYTPEVAKAAGRAINYSPAKIDYIVQGYTGTAGKLAEDLADSATARFRKNIPKPAVPGEEAILGRAPIGSNSESVARFYDYKDNMERQLASEALRQGVPPSEVLASDDLLNFRDAAEQMHELQGMNQQITGNQRMPPETKRTLIDRNNKIITNIARSVVGTFERRLAKPSTGRP